jgi:hypothetical protein
MSLARALQACVDTLRHVEKSIPIGKSTDTVEHTWAELQVRLWLVMMAVEDGDTSLEGLFDTLTARVVALDRLPRDPLDIEISHAAEWARAQTLHMYSSDPSF